MFSRFGYKKATIEDIAASLHRAKSSIYYYFASKEDVFQAVIEYEAKRAQQAIRTAVDNEKKPEDKLRALFITVYLFIREAASYYNLMQEEVIDILDFSHNVKLRHQQNMIALISEILSKGVADGLFQITDIIGTAETIMLAFDGLYYPFFPDVMQSQTKLDHMLQLILNGIRSR